MKIDEEIKLVEENITKLKSDVGFYDAEISRIEKKLSKKIDSSYVKSYIKSETAISDQSNSKKEVVKDVETVTDLQTKYPDLYELCDPIQNKAVKQYDLEEAETELKQLKVKQKNLIKQEKAAAKAEALKKESKKSGGGSFEGHLYPVEAVVAFTEELKTYNKRMDDFITRIDSVSPECDLTWLCEKIEKFCRKINYQLALLRYRIVKALSQMYKQANVFSKLIKPIATFNPSDIFACLGWVKDVITFFFKPYSIVITFIKDFLTYTPPLVSEAASLIGKTASVPMHLIGVVNNISFTANDKNGEKKAIAEVYKDYMQIKFEPITMADIMGKEPEKPTYATSNMTAKQKEIYKNKKDVCDSELSLIWQQFTDYINRGYDENDNLWVAYFEELPKLDRDLKWYSFNYKSVTNTPEVDCMDADTVARAVFGKKKCLSKDIYNEKIRTPFKVYGMYDVGGLVVSMEVLEDKAYKYYKMFYSNVTSRSAKKSLDYYNKQLDWLRAFSGKFPEIPIYLNRYSEKMKESIEIIKKMEDLDKPSVFE